jgi:hypothetical protein
VIDQIVRWCHFAAVRLDGWQYAEPDFFKPWPFANHVLGGCRRVFIIDRARCQQCPMIPLRRGVSAQFSANAGDCANRDRMIHQILFLRR